MKKILFVFALFISVSGIFAQNVKSENGLFYGENHELYTGTYITYYPDGAKKSVIYVKDGKANGKESVFYNGGKLMETGEYSDGLKAGLWLRYNENGATIGEASYLNGKKNGTWIVWDDNGTKRFEMSYINGEKAGTWYNWDERGELVTSTNYGM